MTDLQPRLYIFNPDTDYALASGSDFYTPSRRVVEMTRKMTLYPALWAETGSIILSHIPVKNAVKEAPPGVLRAIEEKRLKLTDWKEAGQLFKGFSPVILPWGWNQVIGRQLRNAGIDLENAPETNRDLLLKAASRENTVGLNRYLSQRFPEYNIPVPVRCDSVEEVLHFRNRHQEGYFKDPWSSSGRGILCSLGLTNKIVMEWAGGVIRRHGFVMAETVAKRIADFATLWDIRSGKADFIGFSMFTTSVRGHFQCQIIPDQCGTEYMKSKLAFLRDPEITSRIISAQSEWLTANSPVPGYASIDMLVESDGNIRPGIEINRRMTMGIAANLIAETNPEDLPVPEPFKRIPISWKLTS